MTPQTYANWRNALVALGLWWCVSFLGSWVLHLWNMVFIYNRIFHGESGSVVHAALSLPPYAVVGFLVGLAAARFIESERPMVWAGWLGILIALSDFKSWNGMSYRGRSPLEGAIVGAIIASSIVFGCWFGVRRRRVLVIDDRAA